MATKSSPSLLKAGTAPPLTSQPPAPSYLGHRARLRKRLLGTKEGQLPDYELLELVLSLAKPRGDTKPLAKSLLKDFGSFAKVLTASPDALFACDGVGESVVAAFRSIHEAAARILKEQALATPVVQSWQALLDYLRMVAGHSKIEEFRVIYLNKKFRIMADDVHAKGTTDRVAVFPREIVKRALYLGASAIILAHNHPSGDITPSKADIDLTRAVIEATRSVNIAVHDHVIIGAQGHYSFKSNGLM